MGAFQLTIDRLPPHSVETENAFLGVSLFSRDALEAGLDIGLRPEDFYRRENVEIWRAMQSLNESKRPVDLVTVQEFLADRNSIESPATSLMELARCADGAFAFNAPAYALVIRDKAIRRGVLMAASQIASLAYREDDDVETLLDKADATLRRSKERALLAGKQPDPSDILKRVEGQKMVGMSTRLPSLNALTAGMVRGHLWVIGGFSSTGKTASLINLTEDVARRDGVCMIASTEMSQEQYMLRLLSVTSGVPQRVLMHGGMTVEQGPAYKSAREFWQRSRVRIFDDLYNVSRIRRKAIKVKEELGGLDVLFVDFLQNLSETGDEVKDARLAAIQLQMLAKELDCCVVALSQISNAQAIQQNESGIGNYYAFKGSGAIKDAADVAVMLDRDRQNAPSVLWWVMVKNRHGAMDKIATRFDLETGRIAQMSQEEAKEADPNAGRKSKR
jgi:replicative DNA helicase